MSEFRNLNALETRFATAVKLEGRPVAAAYLERSPDGVNKFEGSEPQAAAFGAPRGGWKNFLYRAGRSF